MERCHCNPIKADITASQTKDLSLPTIPETAAVAQDISIDFMGEKRMKLSNIVAAIVAFVIALSLCACAQGTSATSSPMPSLTASTAPTTAPPTPTPSEGPKLDGMIYRGKSNFEANNSSYDFNISFTQKDNQIAGNMIDGNDGATSTFTGTIEADKISFTQTYENSQIPPVAWMGTFQKDTNEIKGEWKFSDTNGTYTGTFAINLQAPVEGPNLDGLIYRGTYTYDDGRASADFAIAYKQKENQITGNMLEEECGPSTFTGVILGDIISYKQTYDNDPSYVQWIGTFQKETNEIKGVWSFSDKSTAGTFVISMQAPVEGPNLDGLSCKGTFNFDDGRAPGDFNITFAQKEGQISGNIADADGSNATFTGHILGDMISFTKIYDKKLKVYDVIYIGTFQKKTNEIKGVWKTDAKKKSTTGGFMITLQ